MGPRLVTLALLVANATLVGSSASAADAQHGAVLARRWCSSCHVVASNQRQITGEAPPFAVIASRPDFDVNRLAFFLLDPHPKMPDMGLSRIEATDLAAYISSLRNKP
jgi:mono/diheme cytochrome c family protein